MISRLPSSHQISNTSGPPLTPFKLLSNLDRLRAVQPQYRIDIGGTSSYRAGYRLSFSGSNPKCGKQILSIMNVSYGQVKHRKDCLGLVLGLFKIHMFALAPFKALLTKVQLYQHTVNYQHKYETKLQIQHTSSSREQ